MFLFVPPIYGRKWITHNFPSLSHQFLEESKPHTNIPAMGGRVQGTLPLAQWQAKKQKKKQYNTEIVYILTYKPSPQITLSFSSLCLYPSLLFFWGGGGGGGGSPIHGQTQTLTALNSWKSQMAQPVTGCLLELMVHRNLLPFIRDRAQWVPKPNSITPSHTHTQFLSLLYTPTSPPHTQSSPSILSNVWCLWTNLKRQVVQLLQVLIQPPTPSVQPLLYLPPPPPTPCPLHPKGLSSIDPPLPDPHPPPPPSNPTLSLPFPDK